MLEGASQIFSRASAAQVGAEKPLCQDSEGFAVGTPASARGLTSQHLHHDDTRRRAAADDAGWPPPITRSSEISLARDDSRRFSLFAREADGDGGAHIRDAWLMGPARAMLTRHRASLDFSRAYILACLMIDYRGAYASRCRRRASSARAKMRDRRRRSSAHARRGRAIMTRFEN